jgi:hypothetical protein
MAIVPTVLVGMSTSLGERAADWFGLLAALSGLLLAAMYALPLRVPRLRHPIYGPEWSEHFNHSERKPLIERYALNWATAWLFFGGGNLIRYFDRFYGPPAWSILDVTTLILPVIGILLMFNGFRYKLALDRLVEKEKQAGGR